MVRGAIDASNNSTCNLPYWCSQGFETNLKPIIDHFTADISTTLGVSSNRFTLEIYFYEDAIIDWFNCPSHLSELLYLGNHCGCLGFFFSSQQASRISALNLVRSNRSPAILGTIENVPAVHCITDHPGVFLDHGQPNSEVCFHRYATVPFNWACADNNNRLGIIVLTSLQDDPFSEDLLDVLGFLGSLVANYVSCYNACSSNSKDAKRKADAKRKREEAKKLRSMQDGSPATVYVESPDNDDVDDDDEVDDADHL